MALNRLFSWVIRRRMDQIAEFIRHPLDAQDNVFKHLIYQAENTEYGKKYDFVKVNRFKDFQNAVPIVQYEDIQPYIQRTIEGEQGVLWHSPIRWFAKSSGTTSGKSKLIPVSKEALYECHYKGGKDLFSLYYTFNPSAEVFAGKHLVVGGSSTINTLSNKSYFGDLSAIIIKNLPFWAEIKQTPNRKIALNENWEEKIEQMATVTSQQDVRLISGVPSWTLVLLHRILEITGKKSIKEVWPNLELFIHGGVSFIPYSNQFAEIMGSPNINYLETYNASEGFFGIQDRMGAEDMLLMLDYGIFYEFIPMDKFDGVNSITIPLSEVEIDVNYALVISTNGGLWRYLIGDTIAFTSIKPYRVKVSGRTKHFINVFGEEVIVDNVNQALKIANSKHNSSVVDYTIAPVFMEGKSKGKHQWLIEFKNEPEDIKMFELDLDKALRSVNSDYDAKRSSDLNLENLSIDSLPSGTFYDWMKYNNKLGGQNKIPKLSNERKYVDAILQFLQEA